MFPLISNLSFTIISDMFFSVTLCWLIWKYRSMEPQLIWQTSNLSRHTFAYIMYDVGRSSATRDIQGVDFMVLYRKPPLLRICWWEPRFHKLIHAKLEKCIRPQIYKICDKISHSATITNLHNNETYNTNIIRMSYLLPRIQFWQY